jgi:hypothetical protein
MHHGGPAAHDPYPATPKPFVARKATPDEAAAAKASPAMNVVILAIVVAVGLGAAVVGTQPGRSPFWQSVGPPLVVLATSASIVVVRTRRRAAARTASEAALSGGGPPIAIQLVPEWSGRPSRVRNALVVRPAGDDRPAGIVPMIIKADRFDPRGLLWLYGPPEAGAAVAIAAGDDRPPMLAAGPLRPADDDRMREVHPCSPLINELLGWTGDHVVSAVPGPHGQPVPAPAAPLPHDLAAVARPTLRRQAQVGSWAAMACFLLLPVCAALRPGLVVSIALTAAVWGGWHALIRWGAGWVLRPAVEVLERRGHDAADARFVARALVSMRFGLALPPDPVSAPGAGSAADPPATAGWGYAAQPLGAAPVPLASPGASATGPPDPTSGGEGIPMRTIALAAGLVMVVLGAFVYVSRSPEADTVSVQATVLEAPTTTGGVLLDVPQGGTIPGIDEMTVVQPQPWETHDLDPAATPPGATVDVEVDRSCFCNPSIGEPDTGTGDLLALALVAFGIALAVCSRFLRPGANGSPLLPSRRRSTQLMPAGGGPSSPSGPG